MPNFTKSPCVERLIFKGCVKILEVDDSIEHLKGLKILNLKDCLKLERLSKNFNMLESLEEIDLSGCVYLDELPREMGKFKSLKVFYTYQTAILHKFRYKETPRSTNFSLACLSSSLVNLNLGMCNLSENAFPSDLSMFGSLKKLDISESRFSRLPESIASLPMLNSLILNYCTRIQSLEKLPVNLEWLSTVGCSSLERIESPQLSRVSLFVDYCEKLDEIEGVYKMYPINRIDKAIAKSLSVSNLESLANIEVDMLNDFTYTQKTSSLQVLEEDGVLNIFSAVDDDNPNCFDVLPFGKYILFDVLPNDGHKKIYGMNICISYKVSHNVLSQYLLDAFRRRNRYIRGYFDYEFELKLGLPDLPEKALLLGITNKTKKLEWVYGPTCYAVPRDEEKIQWVSHWRFGDQFEVSDKVSIHVSTNSGFEINYMKCGVKLIYEDEENYEVDWEQTPLDSCWSQREGTPGGVKRFPMDESWEREIEDLDSNKTYEDEDAEEDLKSIIDLRLEDEDKETEYYTAGHVLQVQCSCLTLLVSESFTLPTTLMKKIIITLPFVDDIGILYVIMKEVGSQHCQGEARNARGPSTRQGTDKVRGLVFDLSRLVKSSYGYEEVKFEDDFLTQQQIPSSPLSPSSKGEDLHTESFRMMHELQILQLYGNVEGDSKYLPKHLRLIFRGCINIHEVDESIICLKKLLRLNLKDCTSLGRLPKNFTTLESLEELDLSGCSNLCVSPEELREMKSMKVFHASNENMKTRILKTMKSYALWAYSSQMKDKLSYVKNLEKM
ncbi:hypothetical protein ACFE04_012605 [Oxalis oulophora]